MKHTFAILLAVALTALLSLPANAQSAAEGTWTAKNGDTIEAAFVKLEGSTVHLLLRKVPPSGKANVTVPLNELREADQKYITEELIGGAKAAEAGGKLLELEIKGVKYRFRWCPAGAFTMGSLPTEKNRSDNETAHRVTLTKGFWMAETEVTQEQWESVFEDSNSPFKKEKGYSNPSEFKGAKLPVKKIDWNDCQKFIAALNKHTSGGHSPAGFPKGYKFALPTEAQWEYACRAGSQTAYCFGDDADKFGDYAWYGENSDRKTHAVGTKKPNAWNLYDMHGNAWEWCADGYDDYPSSAVKDPVGAGSNRVIRGGSWGHSAGRCRSAQRDGNAPEDRYSDLGFRLSLVSE